MFTGYSRNFRSGGHASNGRITKVPLSKGLFSDGVWKCNCDPHLPAVHLETKNGKKNHGRWFYKCQRGRCNFFLWDDEARSREVAAVLNNSRTEPINSPQTPTKPSRYVPITPQTSSRLLDGSTEVDTPRTPSRSSYNTPPSSTHGIETRATTTQGSDSAEDELFDWPASDNDELSKAAEKASNGYPMPPFDTPRKAIKGDARSTPGKRRYEEMAEDGGDALRLTPQTPAVRTEKGDIFTTPAALDKGLFASGTLLSPAETPTPIRYKNIPRDQESELAREILSALQSHHASITPEARETLKSICNKHVLHTVGIMKGRDVARAAIKARDTRVTELQGEIESLKAERETKTAAIRELFRKESK